MCTYIYICMYVCTYIYTHVSDFNQKTKLSSEVSYLTYLAQQSGGLSDNMFNQDPFQSNRSRNWFELKWLLYNIKLDHKFSEKTNFTLNFFQPASQK